jgi:hypothetical protein
MELPAVGHSVRWLGLFHAIDFGIRSLLLFYSARFFCRRDDAGGENEAFRNRYSTKF